MADPSLISGETEVVDEDPNAVSGATNDGPTPDGEHVVVGEDPNAVSGATNDVPTPDGEHVVVDPNAVSGATNDGPTPDGEQVVVDPNAVSGSTNDGPTPDGEHVVVDLTVISGATPSTPDISVTEVPLLQQQTLRDESTMKQWENLMIRCHEVIAMLIGFALMFAPIGSIIKALRSEGGQVHPISILKIITIILRNLEIHLVFPFLFWGLGYGLLYVLSSSSALPGACVLWMGALSVIVGFLTLFVVVFYISWQFSSVEALYSGRLLWYSFGSNFHGNVLL